MDQENGSYR